jgi:ribonuclease HII
LNRQEREATLQQRLADMKQFENGFWARGIAYVGGVDEVGRGPLAGPVCAACVVLPEGFSVLGVDDSKKLTEKRRESLYEEILAEALAIGYGSVGHERIDAEGIVPATRKAMAAAVLEAGESLARTQGVGARIGRLLVDAIHLTEAGIPCTAIVKGDAQSVSIAAASIVAKVRRDRLMRQYDIEYPGYAFASNKGYGTKAHYEGLRTLGPSPIHRLSFL